MRTWIFAFCLTLALAPARAATSKQPQAPQQQKAAPKQPEAMPQEDSEEGEEAESSDTEETEVSPKLVKPGTQISTTQDAAPSEVHSVVKGDTLWDLSQRYLGSPWYWPKVWSFNPEIANPHWIYPGNQVRFYRSGDEGPSRVEVATPVGIVPTVAP